MHSEGSHLLCRAAAPGKLAAQWQLTGMEASRPHRCRELIQVNNLPYVLTASVL